MPSLGRTFQGLSIAEICNWSVENSRNIPLDDEANRQVDLESTIHVQILRLADPELQCVMLRIMTSQPHPLPWPPSGHYTC